jgi:hypothetical protein
MLVRRFNNQRGTAVGPRRNLVATKKSRQRASAVNVPKCLSTVKVVHTYRYRTIEAAGVQIGADSILVSAGSTATTAVLLQSVFSSFRVLQFKMWGPVATTASPTISIDWFGNVNGTGDNTCLHRDSDTSISTAYPAFINAKPPPDSFASFWQSGGQNTPFMSLNYPAGTVIDLTLELILFDTSLGGNPQTRASHATIGATVGQLYYTPLDVTTNDIQPIGLVNVINII